MQKKTQEWMACKQTGRQTLQQACRDEGCRSTHASFQARKCHNGFSEQQRAHQKKIMNVAKVLVPSPVKSYDENQSAKSAALNVF